MDLEMNNAAPTQPTHPRPSHSHMPRDGSGSSFQPMGFQHQQSQQTPLSFQQLLQQPPIHSSASLTPEHMIQFQQYQMFQSFFQMMSQSPNSSQVMMQMMTQSPQTSQVSQSRTPQMMPTQQMSQMPHTFQMMLIPQGQQYGQQTSSMMPTSHGQQTSPMMPTPHGQQTSPMMPSSQVLPYYPQMPNVPQQQIPRNASDDDDDDATTNFF
ncbi:uncharacterized protein LOC133833165 [Humulus lupulus]|uniref:uncharacterized protein LOC133833165 n=1 Tax=Humulus lupulus TaxID=3486 RepID=UPI002B4026E2|nr:uncharacterized protein LOC133833165 [Humulus lupulus]